MTTPTPESAAAERQDYPVAGMTKTPYGLPLMAGAWISCVSWAMGDCDAVEAFKAETGIDIAGIARARGINEMIDKASGRQQQAIAKFCDWVTEHLWGIKGEPMEAEST